jgi:hypothetical protein
MARLREGSDVRWIVRVALSVAAVVVLGIAALVTQRFLSDSGLIPTGTGASLINHQRGLTVLVLALASVVVVALVVFLRHRLPVVVMLSAAGVAIVLSAAALIAYPQATNARLVALDPATGRELWSVDTTAEWIAGVTSATGNRVVLAGTDDADHDCEGWRPVHVTIDLARREVVTVRVQPRDVDPADVKPSPTVEPEPKRFRIDQGTPVRRCSR